jgi:hypothetical protein
MVKQSTEEKIRNWLLRKESLREKIGTHKKLSNLKDQGNSKRKTKAFFGLGSTTDDMIVQMAELNKLESSP